MLLSEIVTFMTEIVILQITVLLEIFTATFADLHILKLNFTNLSLSLTILMK